MKATMKMKKLMLMILLLVAPSAAAYGQASTASKEPPLGIFTGKGNIAGGFHTIKINSTLGIIMVTYGGAKNCTAMMMATDNAGVYEEKDYYHNGGIAKDSCNEKGFINLLSASPTTMTFHRGATADEALKKPMPVKLLRIKR